jgi:cell division FtsZ-interacting protein ZapD
VRDNEWLMSIRGRTIIPGGACEFDLPSYYAWQKRPAEQRYADIMGWFGRWHRCSTRSPWCCACCAIPAARPR